MRLKLRTSTEYHTATGRVWVSASLARWAATISGQIGRSRTFGLHAPTPAMVTATAAIVIIVLAIFVLLGVFIGLHAHPGAPELLADRSPGRDAEHPRQ